jgi:dihydroorotate dehydrogenase (NAD+) catalytic subunit
MIANTTGGLSGPAVKPVAVRMVYQVAQGVSIPVIGLGGITSLNDALEFFMAGASAIQIGTAMFVQPTVAMDVIDQLPIWLEKQGCASLSEIVGSANPRFRATAVNASTDVIIS